MMRKSKKETETQVEPQASKAPWPTVYNPGLLSAAYFDDPFGTLQAFDRHFDEMRRRMEALFFAPDAGALGATSPAPRAHPARLDVVDEGKAFVVTAELPGFEKDQVDVQVTALGLELKATRTQESSKGDEARGYLARERASASLHRVVEFPEEVDPLSVTANLKNGVLTVRAAKANPVEEKRRKVEVQ